MANVGSIIGDLNNRAITRWLCAALSLMVSSVPVAAQSASTGHAGPMVEGNSGAPTYRMDMGAKAALGDNDPVSFSYRESLRFARCVAAHDRGAIATLLERAPTDARSEELIHGLALRNRGCVGIAGRYPAPLLRVALTEATLFAAKDSAGKAGPHAIALGIPEIIAGLPLRRVAACQFTRAPQLVWQLFSTEPGSSDEAARVRQLAESLPACAVRGWVSAVHPTAARIALVDAVSRGDGQAFPR